jgi:hypothetical protein
LFAHFANHPAGVGVKNAIAVYVPNVAYASADLLLKIKLCVACNFACEYDEVAFCEGFASDAAYGETWLREVIGYKVTTLNRMGRACDHVAVVTM